MLPPSTCPHQADEREDLLRRSRYLEGQREEVQTSLQQLAALQVGVLLQALRPYRYPQRDAAPYCVAPAPAPASCSVRQCLPAELHRPTRVQSLSFVPPPTGGA